MKRRELLTAAIASGLAAPALAAKAQDHDHHQMNGPLASATVSFGHWPLGSNRFVTPNAPATTNGHTLVPYETKIKAGGTVNFIVSGLHLIAVYEPGTTIEDIDTSLIAPGSTPPGLIDDPNGRVYFGLDPRRVPMLPITQTPPPNVLQDRIEVVQFGEPGRYLVICAVLPHFVPPPPPAPQHPPMHGWVNVLP